MNPSSRHSSSVVYGEYTDTVDGISIVSKSNTNKFDSGSSYEFGVLLDMVMNPDDNKVYRFNMHFENQETYTKFNQGIGELIIGSDMNSLY